MLVAEVNPFNITKTDLLKTTNDGIAIIHIVIQALLYFTGLYIHVKIISVCWKDKEGKTWQIHMTHSISVIIYFTFYIPFFNASNVIPNLAGEYTGEWFCYLATFIVSYGFIIISGNSLLIAVLKYIFIVHTTKALNYGNDRLTRLFFIINLLIPLVNAVFSCLTKDFESFAELNSCFGLTEQVLKQYNTWEKNMQKFFLCNLKTGDDQPSQESTLYIIKQVLCVIKSIAILFMNTNVPEAYFYYKIFQRMNRQVEPSGNNAAKMLSRDMQIRNMRRVKVNAQVTFVVYAFEWVANLSIFIVWMFITHESSIITMIMGLIWYHVILPYIYLMNTSHNKNLLTDDGWWNTIRNTTGLSTSGLSTSCFRPSQEPEKTNVYIISSPEKLQTSESNEPKSIIIGEARASYTNPKYGNNQKKQKLIDIASRKSSETDDDNPAPKKSYRLLIAEKIVKHMRMNINKEKDYLHYLRQLSRFEEFLKEGDVSPKDFEIEHIDGLPIPKIGKIKSSNSTASFKTISKRDTFRDLGKSKNIPPQMISLEVNFVGQLSDRTEMRLDLLDDFQRFFGNEESYKIFLNALFDLEETLTNI